MNQKLQDDVVLIMDNETYVTADSSQTKLQRHYKAKVKDDVADKYRFQSKEKFPQKIYGMAST